MKLNDISVEETLEKAKLLLKEEKNISPALKAVIELMMLIITLLTNRLNLNSSNSSKPPSADSNRKKRPPKGSSGRKPGGQPGHKGSNLSPITDPDEIIDLEVDRSRLPKSTYTVIGYQSRQIIDIKISRHVIEYRAQILENLLGDQFIAEFPNDLKRSVQYGAFIKSHAVYLSQFQLISYNRIDDYFDNELGIPISPGSLLNFNKEAFKRLADFESIVKQKLIEASLLHVDETGINVKGKRNWLHVTANELWTYFFPHEKRGRDAMDDIGILPHFRGTLCHDHWKPYFIYECAHSLCNAHHLRELKRAFEQDHQQWAEKMRALLLKINEETKTAPNGLSQPRINALCSEYKKILAEGELESPLPEPVAAKKKKRIKKTKSRNLLERLIKFEDDTLRFMKEVDVPFTNNLAENNIRMTKVQQKISGCFRSMEGAHIFCRIRSYISTCRKHGVQATEALNKLFNGELPGFIETG